MSINCLADLRPGDIMFGPIGGAVGLGVGLGQLALGEGFHVGRLSIRHVGIVVEASRTLPPGTIRNRTTGEYISADQWGNPPWRTAPNGDYETYETGVITAPRLVQAMPGGAEEIDMRQDTHWTDRHAYVRMPEDYPGQAADAAAIARLMVAERVAYSFASYAALAAWRFKIRTPKLEAWIDRRRPLQQVIMPSGAWTDMQWKALPVEAICSVLVDQAWSLAGKRVMTGVAHQAVTPGAMAGRLLTMHDTMWGGPAWS